jgi:MFS family permease
MPSASALIAVLVPAEMRGTAYGLMGSATSVGFGAGPLAAAGMVAVSGMRSVFVMAAVMFALVTVWTAAAMQVPKPAGGEPKTSARLERASG